MQSARELITRFDPSFSPTRCGKIVQDTSEFMSIDYGDVIEIADMHFLVYRDEAERRFGLEDPKYWVKRCRHLETGEQKILKLEFHENFELQIGGLRIRCFRSPEKEARILLLVKDDMRFMQGYSCHDVRMNNVRVLDIIRGRPVDQVVDAIAADHETYFHEHFPTWLERFMGACEGIAFLHHHWEKHGDVRRDHLLVEAATGQLRWIDFDYAFESHENPFGLDIFGLGNILLFLVGKGIHEVHSLDPDLFAAARLTPDDMSIMFPHRVMNLRKLFPYVPEELNRVLMHFAAGSPLFYDRVEEMLQELRPVRRLLAG